MRMNIYIYIYIYIHIYIHKYAHKYTYIYIYNYAAVAKTYVLLAAAAMNIIDLKILPGHSLGSSLPRVPNAQKHIR